MKNIYVVPKAVRRSIKNFSLKISQYSQENNCVGVFVLVNMQTFKPATY